MANSNLTGLMHAWRQAVPNNDSEFSASKSKEPFTVIHYSFRQQIARQLPGMKPASPQKRR
jgi:hypothetical protein